MNFDIDGPNAQGVEQSPCIDCGACVTGCNVGAKNTLYMNYLPAARRNGAEILTQAQVDWLQRLDTGGWRLFGRHFNTMGMPKRFSLEAGIVVLSAGSVGTPEILLRSELKGLSLSPRVGTSFNGNGDFFGMAYNSDFQTKVIGFGNQADHSWRKDGNAPGPSQKPSPTEASRVDEHGPGKPCNLPNREAAASYRFLLEKANQGVRRTQRV